MPSPSQHLERTYQQRFSEHDVVANDTVWKEIAAYLQRYLRRDGPVLDVACGHGAFIRHIVARERWATDLRDVSGFLTPDIKFVQAEGGEMASSLPHGHFEMVFIEQFPRTPAFNGSRCPADPASGSGSRARRNPVDTAAEYSVDGWEILGLPRPQDTAHGRRALRKPRVSCGFKRERLITRFLPYSTKSKLPQSAPLVHWYLKFPPAWWLMGKQTLYVGMKRE